MKPLLPHQIDRVGRLWDWATATQCRFLMVLGDGYWDERYTENFILLKWKDLGTELQKRIATEWFRLEEGWLKALSQTKEIK